MAEKEKKPEQQKPEVPAGLRDQLACAAMVGLATKLNITNDSELAHAGRLAYRAADAALAARDVPYAPGPTDAERDERAREELESRPVAPYRRPEEWLAYGPDGRRYDGFSCREEAQEFADGKGGKGWVVKKSTANVVADPGPGHRGDFAEPLGVSAGR